MTFGPSGKSAIEPRGRALLGPRMFSTMPRGERPHMSSGRPRRPAFPETLGIPSPRASERILEHPGACGQGAENVSSPSLAPCAPGRYTRRSPFFTELPDEAALAEGSAGTPPRPWKPSDWTLRCCICSARAGDPGVALSTGPGAGGTGPATQTHGLVAWVHLLKASHEWSWNACVSLPGPAPKVCAPRGRA